MKLTMQTRLAITDLAYLERCTCCVLKYTELVQKSDTEDLNLQSTLATP